MSWNLFRYLLSCLIYVFAFHNESLPDTFQILFSPEKTKLGFYNVAKLQFYYYYNIEKCKFYNFFKGEPKTTMSEKKM